jgi:selenium metabolism protein YedF
MSKSVIFIAGDALGRGDDELGEALLLSALRSLPQAAGGPPSHLLFMNAGVKLCCEGSGCLPELRALRDAGAELLCCGTCLDWFELREKLAVGRVSNMVEILGLQNGAARVIRL